MPFRRSIGISLALLVVSANAVAKMPDKNKTHHAVQPLHIKHAHARAGTRSGKHRTMLCRTTHHHAGWAHHRYASADPGPKPGEAPPDTYLGPIHPIGVSQIGTAAWYNIVGSRTSSGEILDTVTATAAHRTLPLASYAKVTNLDSGRSVIVKINDRGPWHRRFIIDLSPHAAEAIGVRSAGVAPVIVEPVAYEPAVNNGAATVAVFQTPAAPPAQ